MNYTYEIAAVDEAARTMEVVYAAEGHPTLRVGVRLPYEGETLEAVIDAFSPVAYWLSRQRAVVPVQVGLSGAITRPDPAPAALTMTPLQFMERFTQSEQLAITQAAQADPTVRMWYDRLIAASEVVHGDARLVAGMDAMVAAGLLTEARRTLIMDWSQPSAEGEAMDGFIPVVTLE